MARPVAGDAVTLRTTEGRLVVFGFSSSAGSTPEEILAEAAKRQAEQAQARVHEEQLRKQMEAERAKAQQEQSPSVPKK